VIGADKIVDGEALYGDFPEDNRSGDTYGPVSYYAYVPFEQLLTWSGNWDDLPAAHAAAIFFELGTLAALFMLGRRLRSGKEGTNLAILLCFAWAACPYTAFALESNTNDALVSLLLVLTLLFLTSPPARGIFLALGSLTKFAPFALAPLFATYGATAPHRDKSATGGTGATGPVARFARVVAPFAAAFAITIALAMAQTLLDPGLSTFWDRTIGNQAGRDSPFSVWGQTPSLEWLHAAVKVAAIGLALLVAFVPRRRDPVTVAALGAGVLIALQLTVDHWFYLYLPWFLPFLFVALLARRDQDLLDRPGAPVVADID
jgi:glycosyl transferase family 87